MNIASRLAAPLCTFTVDVPANTYYDFKVAPESTYPLRGVTYPVDYGNIPHYFGEDGHELDFFIGNEMSGNLGYIIVDRGDIIPDEHKFYVGLTDQEIDDILLELRPVLILHSRLKSMSELLVMVEKFKDKQ